MESDGNIRTPGSAAYFFVGSSRVPCGPAVSGQLTIPVGRPVSNQDVSGPSLIVQMTPSRSQTQDHHARATTVVRTANQPVTMHRFPLQLNHASANHILSPNQHFKHIPVYQVTIYILLFIHNFTHYAVVKYIKFCFVPFFNREIPILYKWNRFEKTFLFQLQLPHHNYRTIELV